MEKLIIFDFDGTIIDTKQGIISGATYALDMMGIKNESYDNLYRFIGPSLRYSFKEYYHFDDENTIEAIKYYREYYFKEGIYDAKLYDGIVDLLEDLYSSGITLSIASAKYQLAVEKQLEIFNIQKYFKVAMGNVEVDKPSTKTETVKRVIDQFPTICKDNIIMVGDSKSDAVGAFDNEVDFVAAIYDRDISEFDGVNISKIAKDISELKSYLLVR